MGRACTRGVISKVTPLIADGRCGSGVFNNKGKGCGR